MAIQYIDINCDVGEGIGNEALLFPLIGSCNIACGGHAGSIASIQTCLKLAKKYRVKVGVHPSYPDRENFGRVSMDVPDEVLMKSIMDQIHGFLQQCQLRGVSLHHIKPHGALYNDIAKDERKALLFLKAIAPYKSTVFLYVPFGSLIQELALSQNFKIKREAFADRNYHTDLSLVSRNHKNAVILNEKAVLDHMVRMCNEHIVKTISGKNLPIQADTFCVHGDTPSAFQILTYITKHLPEHNIYTTT